MAVDPLGDEFDAAEAAASATTQTQATDVSTSVADSSTTQDASQAASQVSPSVPTNPAAGTAATPAAQAAGAPSNQQAAAAPSYSGARDFVAKALGFAQAETYGDDAAFLTALVEGQKTATQRLQEMQQLAQFGQMYLNERQAAHRTPQQAASAAPDPLAAYKAPEYSQAWQSHVERTENGGWKTRDGGDPSVLPKWLAVQQFRADMGEKLLSDPVAFLKPIVTQLAQEQAREVVQAQFGQHETSQYVNGFMSQNAGWLFQADQTGNRINNPMTGQPILSAAGNRFYQHLRAAESLGIQNPKAQENYARALLMADFNQPQKQADAAVAQGDKAKADLLAKMNRNPNASGSFVGPDKTGHTAPASQNENLSIHDRLRQALAGIPDADFNA